MSMAPDIRAEEGNTFTYSARLSDDIDRATFVLEATHGIERRPVRAQLDLRRTPGNTRSLLVSFTLFFIFFFTRATACRLVSGTEGGHRHNLGHNHKEAIGERSTLDGLLAQIRELKTAVSFFARDGPRGRTKQKQS